MGLRIGILIQQATAGRAGAAGSPPTGVGTYIANLLRGIAEVDARNEYVLLFASHVPSEHLISDGLSLQDAGNIEVRRIAVRPVWLYGAWHFLGFPSADSLVPSLDVLHVPTVAVRVPSRVPTIYTVHDLSFLEFPRVYSRRARAFYGKCLAHALRSGAHVVADSAAVAADLLRYGFPEHRVAGIPLAGSVDPKAATDYHGNGVPASLRDGQYLLFTGSLTRRKNLPRLVAAYAGMPAELRERYSLVLAGPRADDWPAVASAIEGAAVGKRVHVLGYVDGSALAWLHRNAAAFVMPSLSEGFGIPVLDSMGLGVPVAVSGAGSLPELVGNAGLFFDPLDVLTIRDALVRLLSDAELRASLSAAGRLRAGSFTWAKTAEKTIQLYRAVGGKHTAGPAMQ